MIEKPPMPFLIGGSLMFWGFLIHHPWLALFAACLIEGRQFLKIEWNFSLPTIRNTWLLCVIIWLSLFIHLIFNEGNRSGAILIMCSWLPMILLPLELVQLYGTAPTFPLHLFSPIKRKPTSTSPPILLHFSHPYFLSTLLATVATESDFTYPLLFAWCLLLTIYCIPSHTKSRLLWILPCLFALSLVGGNLTGIIHKKISRIFIRHASESPLDRCSTMIGQAGDVDLDSSIILRVKPLGQTLPPPRLATSTYDTFVLNSWANRPNPLSSSKEISPYVLNDQALYPLRPDFTSPNSPQQLEFIAPSHPKYQLPAPRNLAQLRNIQADNVFLDHLGRITIYPKDSLIHGIMTLQPGSLPTLIPDPHFDLSIPFNDKPTLSQIVQDLQLADQPPATQAILIHRWFLHAFRYSTHLTIQQQNWSNKPSAICQFLNSNRSGHCEYFATAAALILRQAGTPTRYVFGYQIKEYDPLRNEYLIRNSHAHAWCQYWDSHQHTWIDFDPTPASATADTSIPWNQRLIDRLQCFHQDFSQWLKQGNHAQWVNLTAITLALLAASWILRRLWSLRRRQRLLSKLSDPALAHLIQHTPLLNLQSLALHHLGPRPPGMPYGQWILQLKPLVTHPDTLTQAVSLYHHARFDPSGLSPTELSHFANLVASISIKPSPQTTPP